MGFGLDPEEVKLSEHRVVLVEDRKALAATLILTDRRAVVLASPEPSTLPWPLGGAIGTLIAELFDSSRGPRLSHQIRRDRFASVEQGEKDLIVFHDQGEGYGHTSFAITSRESFADWQHRMHSWAGGASGASPLPGARTLKQ